MVDMAMDRPRPKLKPDELLPLTPAAFRIALALVPGARHGYGIMRAINRMTLAKQTIGPGTLYRSLQRMRVDDLIEDLIDTSVPEGDEDRRRFYRLTPLGRRVLKIEAERLAALVRLAESYGVIDRDASRPAPSPRAATRAGRHPAL
jgi:DNA-binding PadR family transcriptional regulator